ncbi:hypothetical protein HOY82DRAFT_606323 [Tuber indicum]|nr:hypothetical protein HOY82DRAFT_606323 [Tuber indicum]
MTFNTSDDGEANSGTTNNGQLTNGIAVDGWGRWVMDRGRLQLTVGGMGGGAAAGGDMKAEFLKELTHYPELSRRRTTSAAVITPAAILHGTTSKDAIPPTASPDRLINVRRRPNRQLVRRSVGRQSS